MLRGLHKSPSSGKGSLSAVVAVCRTEARTMNCPLWGPLPHQYNGMLCKNLISYTFFIYAAGDVVCVYFPDPFVVVSLGSHCYRMASDRAVQHTCECQLLRSASEVKDATRITDVPGSSNLSCLHKVRTGEMSVPTE